MIKYQLGRKYSILLTKGALSSPTLLDVVRWYHQQDAHARSRMDDAEPLIWMRHLEKQSPRARISSWSPPALVMDEYMNAQSGLHVMDTIPENDVILPSSPNAASFTDARSPTSSTYSWSTTPRHSLEAALSRTRTMSADAQVSFEPRVESGRDSLGGESRRSSDKLWNAPGVDSAPSSLYGAKGVSPNSSRRRLRDITKRLGRRGSDEALSSARNSMSENSGQSASEDSGHPLRQKLAAVLQSKSRPTSLHLHATPYPVLAEDMTVLANGSATADLPEAPTTATQADTTFPSATEPTPRPEAAPDGVLSQQAMSRRGFRRSLPTSSGVFAPELAKRHHSADEQKEREEYELKAQ